MTGHELRAARESLGLDRKQLAERLGVSESQVEMWEGSDDGIAFGEFTRVLALALERIEFDFMSPTSDEVEETLARADAALAGSGRLLGVKR